MKSIYARLLVSELVVVALVVAVFRLVEERLMAGALAGTLFVVLGLGIFLIGLRISEFRRSPTFVMGCIHLFGSALPLMVTRFANSAAIFDDVRVWGLPGPVFHRVSTGIYLLLIVATVFDLFRAWRSLRRTQAALRS